MNIHDPATWCRDEHGYAVCPACGAMIHDQLIDTHASACTALRDLRIARSMLRDRDEEEHG